MAAMNMATADHQADTEQVISQYRLAALAKLRRDPARQILRIAKRKTRDALCRHRNARQRADRGSCEVDVPWFLQPSSLAYAGYRGPWLEEHFFQHYAPAERDGAVYLPIFWDNFFSHAQGHTYLPNEFARRFRAVWDLLAQLSTRDRAYFTLQGIYDFPIWNWHRFPANVVVLSASGYGDIAIPLLKGDRLLRQTKKTRLASFMGRIETDPLRVRMHETMKDHAHFGFGPSWEQILSESDFSLCPRGLGPTSFRLFEALSLTSIPVYIWQRWRWVPFEAELNWSEFSLILEAEEIPRLPRILNAIPSCKRAEMQARIAAIYHDYFSYAGVTRWIARRMATISTGDEARRITAARDAFRF